MARIRFGGGIVVPDDEKVWLVDDPGQEVDDSRLHPGAAVVVGAEEAAPSTVAWARTYRVTREVAEIARAD